MFNKAVNYELNDKVDRFIEWYKKNRVIGYYTKSGEYSKPKELRNFIEKMAVWYELRYPEYEVNWMMPGSTQELKNATEEMFYNNNSINSIINNFNNKNNLKWSNFYNYESFYNSLPGEERSYLDNPEYDVLIYEKINGKSVHIHLDIDGKVNEAEGFYVATNTQISDDSLNGKSIESLTFLLTNLNLLPKNNKFSSAIESYESKINFKKELLNCVMYRIIERGGNRIGARRGLLFAKEFNTNIDIPMIYGIDYSDPGLYEFIAECLKSGGNQDTECLVGYGFREKDNKALETTTIKKIIDSAYMHYLLIVNVPDQKISSYDQEKYELLEYLVNEGYNENKVKHLKKIKR